MPRAYAIPIREVREAYFKKYGDSWPLHAWVLEYAVLRSPLAYLAVGRPFYELEEYGTYQEVMESAASLGWEGE